MTWVPEILGYPTDMTTTPITQLYQSLNLELEVANVSLTSIDLGMSFGLSNVVGGKLTLEGLQAAQYILPIPQHSYIFRNSWQDRRLQYRSVLSVPTFPAFLAHSQEDKDLFRQRKEDHSRCQLYPPQRGE